MNRLEEILGRLHGVQGELAVELDRRLIEARERFHYRVRKGRVQFERGFRQLAKRRRVSLWRYLRSSPLGHILTAPLIYGVFIPMVLLDLAVTLYQRVCFPVYGIPRVRRADYLVIDRHKLPYLNAIERLNCAYCGYGNGLVEYVREVAARTEQFWCPIKHARRTPDPHPRSERFFDYGDGEAFREGQSALRREWE